MEECKIWGRPTLLKFYIYVYSSKNPRSRETTLFTPYHHLSLSWRIWFCGQIKASLVSGCIGIEGASALDNSPPATRWLSTPTRDEDLRRWSVGKVNQNLYLSENFSLKLDLVMIFLQWQIRSLWHVNFTAKTFKKSWIMHSLIYKLYAEISPSDPQSRSLWRPFFRIPLPCLGPALRASVPSRFDAPFGTWRVAGNAFVQSLARSHTYSH